MVFSNLAGTTSNKFSITKVPITNGSTYGENGILLSGNTYDLFWNMSGILGEEYMNKSVIFIHKEEITDLNSCGHPGQYVCSWTYLSKLANIPEELRDTTNNFIMISHPVDTSNYDWGTVSVYSHAVQELTTSYGRRYFRTKSNQNWTAWQRVAFTSEIPTVPTLHAVATSGDYNSLVNKPNVSSGPTVETGTFTLSSTNASVMAYPYGTYVKYGKIVAADISSLIQPNSGATGDIYLSGLPFLPEQSVKGLQIECNDYIEISGESAWSFSGTLSLLDNGTITVAINSLKGRRALTCELIPGGASITGTVTYIAK